MSMFWGGGAGGVTTLSRLIPITSDTPVVDMVSVVPGLAAARGDQDVDANALINSYVNANPGLRSNCVWHFNPGDTFFHHVDIFQDGLTNVLLDALPGTVTFQKLPGNTSVNREYSFFTRNSKGVYIQGIKWRGVTDSLTALAFGGGGFHADSGLYFGSCEDTWVMFCEIEDFGDAAARMTTSPGSSNNQDSFRGRVISNIFRNCTQVTTTPNGSVSGGVGKGGCSDFQVIDNRAYNLKGSFKAACRFPTEDATFERNIIECATGVATSCGIEVLSYTNAQVINNTIKYAQNWALHCYPNGEAGLNKFEYGNYTLDLNTLIDNYRAVRINNAAYAGNGQQATPYNMNLTRTSINGVTYNANSTPAAIVYSGGNWGSGQCRDNTMSNVANSVGASVQTNISASNNVLV